MYLYVYRYRCIYSLDNEALTIYCSDTLNTLLMDRHTVVASAMFLFHLIENMCRTVGGM
jgi:hypothetical protein